jgi:hypothetical protein
VAAKYTKDQRAEASKTKQKLATLDAGGLSFSGPVTDEEHLEISRFILGFLDRRAAAAKPEAPKA